VDPESCVSYDTVGTTVTSGSRLATFVLGKVDSRTISLTDLHIEIEPGKTITIAARLTGTASVDVSASLTWQEER
jgi:hypothetical protein